MLRLLAAALCLGGSVCAGQSTAQLSSAPTSLADQITQALSVPLVARDHWGIYVTTLEGTPIYALNEAQLFQPASNAKLFTTAAAVALLGSERTFTTWLLGKVNTTTHSVDGDLTLLGGGDANLDSQDIPYVPPGARPKPLATQPAASGQSNPMRDINDLVAQLVAKGVRQIHGDVVGDDRLFPWEPYPQDWSIDDAVWGYGAPVSALTVADNQMRVEIRPGPAAGQPASFSLEQAVPYYTVLNEAVTVATKAESTGVQVERSIGSRTLRLYGSIALKDEVDVEHVAIEDPAEYAALVLREALVEHGISVSGTARASHRPPISAAGFVTSLRNQRPENVAPVLGGMEPKICAGNQLPPGVETLAEHTSQPLASDLVFTNKVSQNLHAELLLRHLGRHAGCRDGSALEGARTVRTFLTVNHMDPDEFILFDGSGLSGHDLVTPRATARLLSFAATQPWFPVWRASLPVAGEDGSLAQRFSQPPLKDHVFAKTGTLSEARALSGYLEAASGRTLIFSIMVGNHMPGTSADRDAMDKIVAAIQSTQ